MLNWRASRLFHYRENHRHESHIIPLILEVEDHGHENQIDPLIPVFRSFLSALPPLSRHLL